MYDDALIRVGADQLDTMADHLRRSHATLSGGFESLSAELLRTMADWGDGTRSREAYDGFKQRVDRVFSEMFAAVSAMPPLVAQAAEEARQGEARRAGMWGG